MSQIAYVSTMPELWVEARNLDSMLCGQLERYIELGVCDRLHLDENEYRRDVSIRIESYFLDQCEAMGELCHIGIFDSRIPGWDLADFAGANCLIEPESKVKKYETPAGVYIRQFQLGTKWQNQRINDARTCYASFERDMTIEEGLAVLLLNGPEFLKSCGMKLGGSQTMARLELQDDKPVLQYLGSLDEGSMLSPEPLLRIGCATIAK